MTYFGTRMSENISRREPEGYLICLNVPVARTGVQEYLPEELGLPAGGAPVPVYRPEEEVFAPVCVASFEGMPVTDDHPAIAEGVTAENIRYLQKGHAHNIRRGTGAEADLLLADLIITDPGLIEAIMGGKREISCGYNYALCEEGGRYVQRNIRGNHIAVVDAGRAGPRVSIRDHARGRASGSASGSGNKRDPPSGGGAPKGIRQAGTRPDFCYLSEDTGYLSGERKGRKKDMKRVVNNGSALKNGTTGNGKRRVHRDSYARRTARLMAMMARDGETEELAEMIAEMVEPEAGEVAAVAEPAEEIAEVVEAVLEEPADAGEPEDAAGEAPVAVAVPENHEIEAESRAHRGQGPCLAHRAREDWGEEIVGLLRQILGLLTPGADCGTSEKDEEPAVAAGETVAEAVAETVASNEEDPVETMVAEVVEAALQEEPVEALAGIEEAVEAALAEPDVLDEETVSGLIEQEENEHSAGSADRDRTADALRSALSAFRPALKQMAPAARRQAVKKIAAGMRAGDRKRGNASAGADSYALLKSGVPRGGNAGAELGKRIMEKRNANMRK